MSRNLRGELTVKIKGKALLAIAAAALVLTGCASDDPAPTDDEPDQTETAAPEDTPEATETGADGGESSGEPIVVGAVLDITGAGASLAGPQVKALELVAAQINAEGGIDGRELHLEIIDNQSAEAEAAQATTRLVNEGVDLIIGASRTGPSMAMRQISIDNETPMISLAAGDAIVADAPPVFKTTKGTSIMVQKLVQHFATQGFETVGLLRDGSGFGEGVDALFQAAGEEHGLEVVFDDRFDPQETDFNPLMVRMRDAGADVNVLWAIGSPSFLATNAYRELGVEAALALPTTSPVFLTEAGDNANGVVFPGEKMFVWDELPEDDPQYEVIRQFVETYREEYDEVPDHFAAAARDALVQAVEAFRAAGTDPAGVIDHLESLDGWVGVNGIYDRSADDHVGLGPDDLVIVEVTSGETPFDRWALSANQPE